MTEKGKIRVIKKADAKLASPKRKAKKIARTPARDVVATVGGWVADLKQRKSEETRTAFDRLFNSVPHPAES
jgi:hypothetical protein